MELTLASRQVLQGVVLARQANHNNKQRDRIRAAKNKLVVRLIKLDRNRHRHRNLLLKNNQTLSNGSSWSKKRRSQPQLAINKRKQGKIMQIRVKIKAIRKVLQEKEAR